MEPTATAILFMEMEGRTDERELRTPTKPYVATRSCPPLMRKDMEAEALAGFGTGCSLGLVYFNSFLTLHPSLLDSRDFQYYPGGGVHRLLSKLLT